MKSKAHSRRFLQNRLMPSHRFSGRRAARLLLPAALAIAAGSQVPRVLAQAHQPPKIEEDTYVWQFDANPFEGDADAIRQGRRLYRSTCYICHLDAGGRGPNLRKSRLQGQDFLRIVINGRKGTQMPAWKNKLTEAEMWKILAYLETPSQ